MFIKHLYCDLAHNNNYSFRIQVVPLDWWPVSRDCLAYGVTVAILICIIHDERVEWYEALTLVLLYIVYIAVMYWDKSFQRCTRFRTNEDQISSDGPRVTTGEAVISSCFFEF